MPIPSKFILTTDFPTLANDNNNSADVVIPSAVAIPSNGSLSYSTDLTIGVQGSVARARFKSSVTDTQWHTGTQREFVRTGTNGGPVPYSLYAFTYRISPTILRCQVFILNPYSGITTGATGETISFYVNTFIPPFV